MEFLGGYVKPYRCYVANRSFARMRKKVLALNNVCDACKLQASVNSFLGVLSHYATYKKRIGLFSVVPHLCEYGIFDSGFRKFVLGKTAKK